MEFVSGHVWVVFVSRRVRVVFVSGHFRAEFVCRRVRAVLVSGREFVSGQVDSKHVWAVFMS